jgi:hypothetical protein
MTTTPTQSDVLEILRTLRSEAFMCSISTSWFRIPRCLLYEREHIDDALSNSSLRHSLRLGPQTHGQSPRHSFEEIRSARTPLRVG